MSKNLKEAAAGIFPEVEELSAPRTIRVGTALGLGIPLLLTGVAAGAAFAYFADPIRGRRRRAEVRQQTYHLRREATRWGGRTYRDLRNRARGWLHGATKLAGRARRFGAEAAPGSTQTNNYLH